jgi:hypothetical protein
MSPLDVLVCGGDLVERELSINDGSDDARIGERAKRFEVLWLKPCRPEDRQEPSTFS